MASRYGGITGTEQIANDYQNINIAFENVEADVDAKAAIVSNHINDNVRHVTEAEHTKLASVQPGAEPNQNAFSRVNGMDASTPTDELTIVGDVGVTVTQNPNDKSIHLTVTGESAPGPHAATHLTGGIDPIPVATGTTSGLMPPESFQAIADNTEAINDITAQLADLSYLTDPTRNILIVAKSGGQFSTINDAIDYAKTYCSPTNRVMIRVGPGIYEEEIILYPNPGIDIIGSGSTVTSVQFPSVYPNAPIYTMGEGYFADIGFVSVDGGDNSYAFHFENQTDPAMGLLVFDRCLFLSVNNAGVGAGLGQDTTIRFNMCEISSIGHTAVYCHNSPFGGTSNQLIEFNSCKITTFGHGKCLTVDDAAKMQGNSNSVMHITLANCQSNQPYILYRMDDSTNLTYIPQTGSDIKLGVNSTNTNILGCDVNLSSFATGGVLPVMSNGLFTINIPNASRYDYIPFSAVDGNGVDVLSTVSFVATSDGYVAFNSSAASVKGSFINFNVIATAK